jgi:hypothetical protein
MLDGVVMRTAPLVVRTFDNTYALGVDVAQLNVIEVSFSLPICLSGGIDLSSKTFSFRAFYYDGNPPGNQGQFYLQTALPTPQTNAYLDQIGLGSGQWVPYSTLMSKSSFSGNATTVTIQAGSYGAAFSGTLYFDDFKIQ